MRFTLVTTGSWGDTAPFLGLALGLQKHGHTVLVAGPAAFTAAARSLDVAYHPLPDDKRVASNGSGKAGIWGKLNTGIRRLETKRKIFYQVNTEVLIACQASQVIAYRIGGYLAGDSIAEKLQVPCFKVGLVPYTPTGQIPSMYLYPRGSSGVLRNRLSHLLGEQLVWQSFRHPTNTFRRRDLGLPAHPFLGPRFAGQTVHIPTLYAISPVLVRQPPDWPEDVHITGHWPIPTLDGWSPTPELENFMRSGPPPIYIGFGSMPVQDVEYINGIILQALELCGQRAILCGDLGKIPQQPRESGKVFREQYLPHDWLFPQVSCAVHHGGIGTTTMQLQSGVPAVIVPLSFDQPFWGDAVTRLGVAPAPIPYQRLSAENLAKAITCCLESQEMRTRAAEIAQHVRSERGIETAIEIMHSYMEVNSKM